MPVRPRHPSKELEAVLRAAEQQGWRVTKRPRAYFKMFCPCPEEHIKTVKITPSDPRYRRHLLGQLRRSTCWKDRS